MKREAPSLHSSARPIDAGILQHSRREIRNNVRDTSFAAEPIKERCLSFDLKNLVGSTGGGACPLELTGTAFFFPFSAAFSPEPASSSDLAILWLAR
jgi:hypothetical protein